MARGQGFEPIDASNMAILVEKAGEGFYCAPIEWRSADTIPSTETPAFDVSGVTVIVDAQHEPEGYDDSYFYLLGRLPDGRYVTCEAWNDSTGWGCQDGRTWTVADTLHAAVTRGLSEEARSALGLPNDSVALLAWEREAHKPSRARPTMAEDIEHTDAEQRGYRAGVMAVERAVQQLLQEMPAPRYRTPICGMVTPHATPSGNPVACAWAPGHLARGLAHSWADLPTITAQSVDPKAQAGP